MEVDFSELKLPVGRPPEEQMEERKDLTKYIREQQFIKRWKSFFDYWERAIRASAKRNNKPKYVDYMEEFYGEVIEKFCGLPEDTQLKVSTAVFPIDELYKQTNLSEPTLFAHKVDNDTFLELMKLATI